MINGTPPKLCLGTFFILVLTALKQRMSAREHYNGESDNLRDTDVLQGLVLVIKPSYALMSKGSISSKVNELKSCRTSTAEYLPFGNTPEIEEFGKRIRSDYCGQMKLMADFARRFLEIGTESKKDNLLTAALIELVMDDDGIDPSEEFYVTEDGRPIKKADFADLNQVCLPAVMLGVLDYAVSHRQDNKIGRETFELWCQQRGCKGSKYIYVGGMGNRLKDKISVYMPSNMEENMSGAEVIPVEVVEDKKADVESPSQAKSGTPIAETITNSTVNIVNCEKNYDFKNNQGSIIVNL